jgi:hypothetical protein
MSKHQQPSTFPRPARRPVPIGVGFASPHGELHHATFRLERKLSAAESSNAYEVGLYSATIQVFAAMTIEAALNVYAIVRFGQAFYQHCLRKSARKRYEVFFGDLGPHSLYKEGRACMERLFTRRNDLVHPASGEYHYAPDGTPKPSNPPALDIPTTAQAARDAIKDMDRLFAIIRQLDDEVDTMLLP